MAINRAGASPELIALLGLDPVMLTTRLFVTAFTPKLGQPYPACRLVDLVRTFAELGEVPVRVTSWHPDRFPDGPLARRVVEILLLWEGARLAARGMAYATGEAVLLDGGEAALRSADPETAVRAAVQAELTHRDRG